VVQVCVLYEACSNASHSPLPVGLDEISHTRAHQSNQNNH
jgi:hypothetical protein